MSIIFKTNYRKEDRPFYLKIKQKFYQTELFTWLYLQIHYLLY